VKEKSTGYVGYIALLIVVAFIILDIVWGRDYYRGWAEFFIVRWVALILLMPPIIFPSLIRKHVFKKYDFEKSDLKIKCLVTSYYYFLIIGMLFWITLSAIDIVELRIAEEVRLGDISNVVINLLITYYFIYWIIRNRKNLNYARSTVGLLELKAENAKENKNYELEAECWEKVIELEPSNCNALISWGMALFEQADKVSGDEANILLDKIFDKFIQVLQYEPKNTRAISGLGACFHEKAGLRSGQEQEEFYNKAVEKYLEAEELEKGSASYFLASIAALMGHEEECRNWLLVGQDTGNLDTYEYAYKDKDFVSVRDKAWFKEIQWDEE